MTLEHLAREVERRLRTIDGLNSVETDMDRGGFELQVRLDRDQAQRLGVETRAVSGTISYMMRGFEVSKYYTDSGQEVDIRIQLKDVDEQNHGGPEKHDLPGTGRHPRSPGVTGGTLCRTISRSHPDGPTAKRR